MIYRIIYLAGREIHLLGVDHTQDFRRLSKLKEKIEKINPEIILIEGNFDKANFPTEEIARSIGEMGLISHLAKKKGIIIKSNDPLNKTQERFISKEFSEDLSKFYFLLRNNLGRKLEEVTKNQINKLMLKLLGEEFNETKDYSDYFNPTKQINLLNRITRKLNNFRDDFMLRILKEEISNHKIVLVVKGEYHIFSELPKLKKEFNGS